MDHPIENIMRTTMESLNDMIDVNTVVGDPVSTGDGTMIIPISKVCFGFAAGGGEYSANPNAKRSDAMMPPEKLPFAGGAGAGVSVHPLGFLVVGGGTVRMLPADSETTIDRVVELIPQLIKEIKDVVVSMSNKGVRYATTTQQQPAQVTPSNEL